jgi:hypothetical protein
MKRGDIVRIIKGEEMGLDLFIGNNDEYDPAMHKRMRQRIRVGFRISDIEGQMADIQFFDGKAWIHAYTLPLKFLQLVSKG